VQAGDTLSAIAVRFDVTQAALLAANNLTDANAIVVGQTLTIPDSGGTTTTMTNKASSGVQVSRTTSQTYTVQAGDSLSAIAVRFGVTQAALLAANKLTDANSIIVGQTLTIPGGNQTMSTQAAAPQTQTYVVQAGDTLSAIALRFNVTQAALLAANHLTNANSIIVGQTLTIPASSQTFAPSDSR
jgi:lysozyme